MMFLTLIGALIGIVAGLMPAHGTADNGFAAVALGGGLWVLFQSGEFDDFGGGGMFFSSGRGWGWIPWWMPPKWGDYMAPPKWSGLLTARDRAAAWYAREFLRGPIGLQVVFEWGSLALLAILTLDLFFLPWQNAAGRWAELALKGVGPLVWLWGMALAVWLAVLNVRYWWRMQNSGPDDVRSRLEAEETADEEVILEALGGMAALGRRMNDSCHGAAVRLPSFWRGFLLAVPFAGSALRFLWPHHPEAALAVTIGVVMVYFDYQAYLYCKLRYQARHPERTSPCRSLPLRYFIRKAADFRDWRRWSAGTGYRRWRGYGEDSDADVPEAPPSRGGYTHCTTSAWTVRHALKRAPEPASRWRGISLSWKKGARRVSR